MQYEPVLARTQTHHRPTDPVGYDCVKIVTIRDGSAFLFSEFGQQAVNVGDVVLLGANVLCGAEPEDHITTTTLYIDTDYVVELVFWRHANILRDRLDAHDFTNTIYSERAQILHLGEARAGMLMPWLDEITALSLEGQEQQKFHRVQALWFSILDVIDPYVHVSPVRASKSQRARSRPTWPRGRRFAPLRDEARTVHDALHADPHRTWHIPELADLVFLSTRQLTAIFADAYGKTPLAYLTMLRVQEMAKLIRETNLPISDIARQVGWQSRNRASEAFKTCVGVSPAEYRARAKELARHALAPG